MEDKLSESTEQVQDDELQQLVDDVEGDKSLNKNDTEQTADNNNEDEENIDILNLPPRSDVHSESQGLLKINISRALKSFIIVIVILILAFGTAFYFWGEELWSYIMNM